jgi:hypothetical protein
MLAKCAEAQAIRKGLPEDLSSTLVAEEIEQVALTPKPQRKGRRANALNGSAATARSSSIGSTPHLSTRCPGQLAYRIAAFLRARREDPQALIILRERNRHALRELWARAPR